MKKEMGGWEGQGHNPLQQFHKVSPDYNRVKSTTAMAHNSCYTTTHYILLTKQVTHIKYKAEGRHIGQVLHLQT